MADAIVFELKKFARLRLRPFDSSQPHPAELYVLALAYCIHLLYCLFANTEITW